MSATQTTPTRLLPELRLSSPSHPDALVIDTPVVLAPMAGITNTAFRRLCRGGCTGLEKDAAPRRYANTGKCRAPRRAVADHEAGSGFRVEAVHTPNPADK